MSILQSSCNNNSFVSNGTSCSIPAFSCFESVRELHNAVDTYISLSLTDGTSGTTSDVLTSNVSFKYGYPIGTWCVSKINDFGRLFSSQRNANATFFNEDLSGWDTSNVVSMVETFAGAARFNQNLFNWNLQAVTSIDSMFDGASSFVGLGLESWDVSTVTSMQDTFRDAIMFDANLSTWDVSAVRKTNNMFRNAVLYSGAGISAWNVSSIIDMSGMFWNSSSFNEIISSWTVNNVLGMENMFRDATVFDQDLSSWNVSAVFRMSGMFQSAGRFNQNLCSWGLHLEDRVITTESMFVDTNCPNPESPTYNQSSSVFGPLCMDCATFSAPTNSLLTQQPTPTNGFESLNNNRNSENVDSYSGTTDLFRNNECIIFTNKIYCSIVFSFGLLILLLL